MAQLLDTVVTGNLRVTGTILGTLNGNASSASQVNVSSPAMPSSSYIKYYPIFSNTTTAGLQSMNNSERVYIYEDTNTTFLCAGSLTTDGAIGLRNHNGNYVNIYTTTFTTNRNIYLPDASGTICLTDGTGASGTWGISITGNAVTATSANLTTTQNAIAKYSNVTGQFANTGVIINSDNIQLISANTSIVNAANKRLSWFSGTNELSYITTASNGNLAIRSTGSIYFTPGTGTLTTASLILSTTDFSIQSGSGLTTSLGNSSVPWNGLYTTTADIITNKAEGTDNALLAITNTRAAADLIGTKLYCGFKYFVPNMIATTSAYFIFGKQADTKDSALIHYYYADHASNDNFLGLGLHGVTGILRIYSSQQVKVTTTTDASSYSTGAFVASGGVGIAKKLYVGTGIYTGAISIGGSSTASDAAARKISVSTMNLLIETPTNYGIIFIQNGSNKIRLVGNTFYPETTNNGSLGLTDHVWANIYATTFNGDVEGNAKTATTLKTAINLWGNSFNGSTSIDGNIVFGNENYIESKITRKKSGGSGWAFTPLIIKDNAGTDFAHFGVYGTANTMSYIYIGANNYSGNNLRITPDGEVYIPVTTASTSTSTGALTVGGGIGVTGTIYAGGFNGPLTGHASDDLALSGGTVSGNITMGSGYSIQREGQTVSYWQGRDTALVKITSYTGYSSLVSAKTTGGSWEIGPYSNNELHFVYVPDSSYSSSNNTGVISSTRIGPDGKLYNAVWNDYAEYRACQLLPPGACVRENDDGKLTESDERLIPGACIISDTFGYAQGETIDARTPIAVSGRVLAHTFWPREFYHAGQAVCSAPDGTIDIMTREEIRDYPDAIIGIVSEIPNYEYWGTGNIKVNGRIWIKVK